MTIHSGAGLAVVTHPNGNMVTIWSISNRALLKVLELQNPRGVEITTDEQAFIISYGAEANLVRVPLDELEPDMDTVVDRSYITGSHIN
ncbi:MAG: hypothetical protein ACR2P6_02015 [Gammaproteobacteria bacterium]